LSHRPPPGGPLRLCLFQNSRRARVSLIMVQSFLICRSNSVREFRTGSLKLRHNRVRKGLAAGGGSQGRTPAPNCNGESPPGRQQTISVGRSSGSRRSDDSNPVTAVGAGDESCRLNSRGNFNILSEAWIHAPELISDRISVNPIDEELCPSLVSREVRR
jgi:hypothetical protein